MFTQEIVDVSLGTGKYIHTQPWTKIDSSDDRRRYHSCTKTFENLHITRTSLLS